MIDNWNPSSNMSDDDQRVSLARRYLKAGSLGRRQYAEKAARNTTRPTDAQIENILQPLRAPALRSVANTLTNLPDSSGPLWLRIHYEDQQGHEEFCRLELRCVDSGDGLREDSIILSDERYYNVGSCQDVLEFLPEIVVNHHRELKITEAAYRGGDSRRKSEREYMACESSPEIEGAILAKQQYWCTARFMLVEDKAMYASSTSVFHAVWLDDCGNVVREKRVTAEDACNYFAMAAEGAGHEQEIWSNEASIGPEYLPGAEYGPPFSMPSTPSIGGK